MVVVVVVAGTGGVGRGGAAVVTPKKLPEYSCQFAERVGGGGGFVVVISEIVTLKSLSNVLKICCL